MMVLLKSLLRWVTGALLPLLGLRVPVRMLCGKARASGLDVRLLSAGHPRWSTYIIEQFFAGEPHVEKQVRVPVWKLQRLVDQWQPAADLTLIGIDNLSARLFLARDSLPVPPLISCWMSVPESLPAYLRGHSRAESDFRRVKRQGFTSQFIRASGEFDLFYDQFYRPYMHGRHTKKALVAPRWLLRLAACLGYVQWVLCSGEPVAGDLVLKQGRDYIPLVTGLRDGRQELLQQGALTALYVHSLEHARHLGCTRILLGGSKPSLHDGVMRYKSKWLDGLTTHDGHLSGNHTLHLRWSRLTRPVADFLSHTGLIHHQHTGFSALWAFPRHLPLTTENLQREYHARKLPSLRLLRIMLPGRAPTDFVCPPDLRLIEFVENEELGPAQICSINQI